jgi:Amt family ammonium transporter
MDDYQHEIPQPSILVTVTGAVAAWLQYSRCRFCNTVSRYCHRHYSSVVCYYSLLFFKTKLGFDDSLDVFAVHGIGGIIGMLS